MNTYRLTEKAKQALSIAKKEAQLLRNRYAGTEHILLGLLNSGDNLITRILEEMSVDVDALRNTIYDNIAQEGDVNIDIDDILFTPRVERIIESAHKYSIKLECNKIDVSHIFLSVLHETDGVAGGILQGLGVYHDNVKQLLSENTSNDSTEYTEPTKFTTSGTDLSDLKNLQKYCTDVTMMVINKKIDPVIGRSREMDRVVRILCRRIKSNPILIGEAGVGKTAIIEGLAQRIVDGRVPEILHNVHIFSLDLGALVAGTKYRGQFEERMKLILAEVKRNKNIIVFIDEIHMISSAGSADGAMDAGNLLKPSLVRGEIKCIGATTLNEYRKYIESDNALNRRFQPVRVSEPSADECIEILNGIKTQYEVFHNVHYTDESIRAAVALSSRYIKDRQLPDKAVDLIDEAGATNHIVNDVADKIREVKAEVTRCREAKEELIIHQKFEEACIYRDNELVFKTKLNELLKSRVSKQKKVITEDMMKTVIENMTGITITLTDAATRISHLEGNIKKKVIGQDGAVKSIVNSLKRSAAGLQDPNRPLASFLLLGSTGIGKTYLAKTVAKEFFNNEDSYIQIDMSEMIESHSVSKLIGSPPGYVGYDKGGNFSEKIRRNPYSLILFDEIEKAHPEVLNTLLQILDEGQITDSAGRAVNFRNTVIVMTTNVGADKCVTTPKIGFVQAIDSRDDQKAGAIVDIKKHFKPELLNRIDEMIVFNSLTQEDIKQIAQLVVDDYILRMKKVHDIELTFDTAVITHIAKEGFSDKYGAREIKRVAKQLIETKLSECIISKQYTAKDKLVCKLDDTNAVTFSKDELPVKLD